MMETVVNAIGWKKLRSVSARLLKLLSVTVLSIAIIACTKKRDPELAYGEDRELLEIAAFDGKEFNLKTFNIVQAIEGDKKLKINDTRAQEADKNRSFGFVKYESEDPLKLTDNTQMLGLENKAYKTKYFFQGDLLKVMKLAELKDLAPDEIPSAIDNKDSRFMVPIVSYEVSYFRVDQKRNDYNEKTSRLELISLQGPMGATHFKIDHNSKKKAAFLPKTTVLPTSFFKPDSKDADSKDWYFAATYVNTAVQSTTGFAGEIWASDKFGNSASRVRLDISEKGLNFYNLNIDERLAEDVQNKKEHQASALFIPTNFKDYKFSESGKATNVKEADTNEAAWSERKFAELKLDEVVIAGSKEGLKVSEVLDMQIDDGYISFLVKDEASNSIVRVSLYKVDAYKKNVAKFNGAEKYVPKVYLRDDQTVFGFFPIQRKYVRDQQNTSQDEGEKRAKLVRYNPTRKTIEYRLNMDAPDWSEEIFAQALEAWNATFKAAGSDIRIKYKDERGKVLRGQVGDLRYSLVNFLAPLESANFYYGGFGPSVADLNGEIIMSTATLNAKLYFDVSESNLEAYLRSLKGEFKFKSILGFSFPGLRSVVDSSNQKVTISAPGLYSKLLRPSKLFKYFDPEAKVFRNDLQVALINSKQRSDKDKPDIFGSLESVDKVMPLTIEAIEEHCPAFYQYSLQIKDGSSSLQMTQEERALVTSCAVNIAKPRLAAVLLHELGHNFGLRHNFYGSADLSNFYQPIQKKVKGKDKTIAWHSSSVMDYLAFDEDVMSQPGLYDIAALRWGYTGAVETVASGIQKSNETIPLRNQFGARLKSYKYCTDENIFVSQTDPFCAQDDIGADPEQAVDRLIQKYEAHVARYSYRNGRDKMVSSFDQANYRAVAFIEPMMKFYEMWRLQLSTEHGQDRMYLEDIETDADYERLKSRVFEETRHGLDRKLQAQWNRKYYEASRKVFNFLMRTVLTPDYSCVASKELVGENHILLFSFSKIQSEISARTSRTVMSCSDPDVVQYLKQTKDVDVVAEGGKPFYNIYSDLNRTTGNVALGEVGVTPEIAGFVYDRWIALLALTNRASYFYQSQHLGFTPNFVDEKPFRDKMAKAFIDRISKGVNIDSLKLDRVLTKQIKPEQFAVSFAVEKPLLNLFMTGFKKAVGIDGKPSLNSKRLAMFSIQRKGEFSDGDLLECTELSGIEYCAKKKHELAVNLIKEYKRNEEIQKAWIPTNEEVEFYKNLIKKYIPAQTSLETFSYLPIAKIAAQIEKLSNAEMKENLMKIHRGIFSGEIVIYRYASDTPREKVREEGQKNGLSDEQLEVEYDKLRALPFMRWFRFTKLSMLSQLEVELTDFKDLKKYEDYIPVSLGVAMARFDKFLNSHIRNKNLYENDPTEWGSKGDILAESIKND